MRYFIAVLFSISLFQVTACKHTAESEQNHETIQETTAESASPAPLPHPPVENQAPEEGPAPAPQVPQPTAATTASKPQAVKTAQKKVLNESPKKKQPKPEESSHLSASKDEEVSAPAADEKIITPSSDAAPIPATTAAPQSSAKEPLEQGDKQADHSIWDELLQKHVSPSGKVNYEGFKSDQARLKSYLDELSNNPIQSDWSRAEKIAYWINVYNAFTIQLILDNYPVSSITKLHGGKPWDVKWIKLGGKTYSLNQVENDILRPQYKDARIHFAVNCAAKSCPPLLNRAWTGDQLNTLLEKQTKAFVNNSKYNTISAKKVNISKIFEWYASDFGNLIEFLNKYSETSINKGAGVSYQEYDWALNN